MFRVKGICGLLAVMLSVSGVALAAEKSMPASYSAVWQSSKSLSEFAKEKNQRFLFLRQAEAQHTLTVPVPNRISPTSMQVHLVFTNSTSLIRERSQLRLRLNGGVVAQTPLDSEYPDGSIDVNIPLDRIQGGNNQLMVEVSQHYQADCEDPGSPELWTSIDLEASNVTLKGRLMPVKSSVAELDRLLIGSSWDEYEFTMVPLALSPDHLHAGSILSQAIALRTDVSPVHAVAAPWLAGAAFGPVSPDSDIVVFGTLKEVQERFPDVELAKDAIGKIMLRARPSSPGRFMLLVVAASQEKLVETSRSIAWATIPFEAVPAVDVFAVKASDTLSHSSNYAVAEGREYSFSELGFKSATIKGLQGESSLNLWLSPDLFSQHHSQVKMRLHFAYGAALRADSVMNVYLNGQFLRGISLGDPLGLTIQDYQLNVPLSTLRPGRNEFKFEARMRANTGTNCTTGNTDNLLFTLFEDSSLAMPDSAHFVAMPDLYYTTNTGYPYLGYAGQDALIQIKESSPALLSSAWTVAAKLGKLKGAPIDLLKVSTDAAGAGNVIRLAALQDVEPEFWQKAPINLGEKGFINHPSLANPSIMGREPMTWRKKLHELLEGRVGLNDPDLSVLNSTAIQQSYSLLNSGVWLQMENPAKAKGTLSLIVADGDEKVFLAVKRLVALWPEMHHVHGDLLMWGSGVDTAVNDFWSASLAERHYHIGSMPLFQRISYFAIQYPGFLIGLLLVVFVGMALLSRWLLVSYRKTEHPTIES